MKTRFQDKVIIITGAAGGLGSALSETFGKEGAIIAGIDIIEEELKSQKDYLNKLGIQFEPFVCDITNKNECNETIETIKNQLGDVYLLINNAGTSHRSPFTHTDVSVIEKIMQVNFFGAVYCTKATLPDIIKQKGMIIVISSFAGVAPLVARTGYSASKHALQGFFESLRAELMTTGVKLMMVNPAFIATNIDKNHLNGDGQSASHKRYTIGRESSPEFVSKVILKSALKGKRMLIPTTQGKFYYVVRRLFPALYDRLMLNKLRGEMGNDSLN